MDVRGIGATRISLRKPNSRSHIMDIPDHMAEKIKDMATMPGKINWR